MIVSQKYIFFFYPVFFTKNSQLRDSRVRWRTFLTPFNHFHPLQEHLNKGPVATADRLSLQIASDRIQTRNY